MRLARIGYHGKVPVRGDFVSRDMDRAFQSELDGWLQNFVHESRAAMGSRWLDAFLNAPIWHFAIRSGEKAYAGSMIPSVDTVGRYFPFVIVLEFEDVAATTPLAAVDAPLTLAEPYLLSVLEEDFDLDYLDYQLARLARKPLAASDAQVPDAVRDASALWWTKGTERRPAAMLALDDWPHSSQATDLLESGRDMALETLWDRCRDIEPISGFSTVLRPSATDGDAVAYQVAAELDGSGFLYAVAGPVGIVMSDGRFGVEHEPLAGRFLCHALAEGLADAARIEHFVRIALDDRTAPDHAYLSYLHVRPVVSSLHLHRSGPFQVWSSGEDGWQPIFLPDASEAQVTPRSDRPVVCITADMPEPRMAADANADALARRVLQEAMVAGRTGGVLAITV